MSVHMGGFKSTPVCQEVFISIGRPFKEKSISVSTVEKKPHEVQNLSLHCCSHARDFKH